MAVAYTTYRTTNVFIEDLLHLIKIHNNYIIEALMVAENVYKRTDDLKGL